MKLIEQGQEVQFIDIDSERVPCAFLIIRSHFRRSLVPNSAWRPLPDVTRSIIS